MRPPIGPESGYKECRWHRVQTESRSSYFISPIWGELSDFASAETSGHRYMRSILDAEAAANMSGREKKRKSLSLSQKLDIIRKIEANPQQRKAVIAEELGIPFSTLCNIWRDRQKYVNNVARGTEDLSRKRSRTAKLETVDENLLKWFSDSR